MADRETALCFALTVITKLALDSNNTVEDTAKKLGTANIAEIIEFRESMYAHYEGDYELCKLKAASYTIERGEYEYEDMGELQITSDCVVALKQAKELSEPVGELAKELYDILVTGRYREVEQRQYMELTREMYRSRFFRALCDRAYTKGYNRYMNEHLKDIPRIMPCFAEWSEKIEREARVYAEEFSRGWAQGACEVIAFLVEQGRAPEALAQGMDYVDADIVLEFIEILRAADK